MILIDGITEADRRARVREYANITTASYSDAELDRKILNADDMIQIRLQTTTPSRHMITLSNMQTAINILSGLGSSNYDSQIQNLKDTIKEMIESVNNMSPEQNAPTVMTTSGIKGE